MKKFSIKDTWDRFSATVYHLSQQRVSSHAASTGYFIVLSVFPLLVLVLSLLRYTGLQVETLMKLVEGFLPKALTPSARRLILNAYQSTSGTVISLSAITGLWSASRGIYGLLNGLNAIYEVEENRGYIRTRLVSMFYTFLLLLMLVITLVLNVFGTSVLQQIPWRNAVLLQFLWELLNWRFLVMLLLQTALFSAMFMALPNRHNTFRGSLPGALLASFGWLIFSDLYSVYVQHFSGYASVYGSVYAVALAMLWLYFCLTIVFYGGALNHYLQKIKE